VSDGQSQTCESIQQQNAIDWTKPVEYCDYYGLTLPVVHFETNSNGSKMCLVRNSQGQHFAIGFNDLTIQRFRNVRRKVKHKKEWHWVLTKRGYVRSYDNAEDAKEIAAMDGDWYRYHCVEWEVESDE
jgi:hypothetical protein